jgi:hypothetical protein
MQIKTEAARNTLTQLTPSLSTKDLIEQANCFLFNSGLVYAFDGEVCIGLPSPFHPDLKGAVEAQPVLQLLDRTGDKELEVEQKEGILLFKGKRSKAGFPFSDKLKLKPIRPEGDWKKIEGKALTAAVKMVEQSASDNASRPILTTIHLTDHFLEAADGFQLTRYAFSSPIKKDICIPVSSMRTLTKYSPTHFCLAKDKDGGSWVHWKNKELTLSCRTIEGDYPDVTKLLDVKGKKLKLDGDKMRAILSRARIFSETEFAQDERVRVTAEAGQLTISAKGTKGWFRETTKKMEGPDCQFKIHPGFFEHALELHCSLIVGDDKILLKAQLLQHVVALETSPDPRDGG